MAPKSPTLLPPPHVVGKFIGGGQLVAVVTTGLLRQKTTEKRRVLERERDELQRRLSKWYELLESGRVEEADAIDRIQELRTKAAKVKVILDKVHALHSVPPYLYRRETIEKFQERLRRAFLSGDRGVARIYLNQLIERIVVEKDAITIDAKAEAALELMARGDAAEAAVIAADKTLEAEVLASAAEQRPQRDSKAKNQAVSLRGRLETRHIRGLGRDRPLLFPTAWPKKRGRFRVAPLRTLGQPSSWQRPRATPRRSAACSGSSNGSTAWLDG